MLSCANALSLVSLLGLSSCLLSVSALPTHGKLDQLPGGVEQEWKRAESNPALMTNSATETKWLPIDDPATLSQTPINLSKYRPQSSLRYVRDSGVCETRAGVHTYSGYIPLQKNQSMFFWFFEARYIFCLVGRDLHLLLRRGKSSFPCGTCGLIIPKYITSLLRHNSAEAPVILWINGGPGTSMFCSCFCFCVCFCSRILSYSVVLTGSMLGNWLFINHPCGTMYWRVQKTDPIYALRRALPRKRALSREPELDRRDR